MLLTVDSHSGVPVYRQVMDQVKFHIASGLLRAGDELPPTRALSAQLGVNPMTISKAYSFLEKENVVERRPGRPLIVKPLREEQMMAEKIDQLRQDLQSTVRIVQQLSITHDEALALFRQMLKAEEK
jgi:GntR family transcriptional regulator